MVVCHGRIRPEQIELLARLERERPWVPVVLVADPDPELARQLLRVRTAAMVWSTELETHLRRRLDAVRATWGLWSLAVAFDRSSLPPALRKALVHAVERAADRPVRNVRELARDVGCAPVTLFRQFGARANGATTLSAFIAGLSVLRVYELRRSGLHWKRVEQHVQLGRATITRRAKAWPGCPPAELVQMTPDRLFAAFTAEHVRPILPTISAGISTLDQE
ncbi:MAG: hypothetical protein F4164_05445 [Gemmatimonadales bacterium]|nr:hypothetical protein [Gemmatimonadales bacterium]MYG48813.1 hypothetical protein [Gemmatimonadales bacterium]MYK01175.1 hypothetical protein [Candidatus Palauibacter ramosifaciens]